MPSWCIRRVVLGFWKRWNPFASSVCIHMWFLVFRSRVACWCVVVVHSSCGPWLLESVGILARHRGAVILQFIVFRSRTASLCVVVVRWSSGSSSHLRNHAVCLRAARCGRPVVPGLLESCGRIVVRILRYPFLHRRGTLICCVLVD